jgi:hypothetical protein
LLKALLGQFKERSKAVLECIHVDLHGKGVSNGLCYVDSATVNLQVHFFTMKLTPLTVFKLYRKKMLPFSIISNNKYGTSVGLMIVYQLLNDCTSLYMFKDISP